jgi:hypothetical protein
LVFGLAFTFALAFAEEITTVVAGAVEKWEMVMAGLRR